MSTTKSREITITRAFDVPLDLMWKVWTEPDHIKNWWGPAGYSNTISQMDLRVGGTWKFMMRSEERR